MSTYLPTIKQLQYLVALHEHGHFGRAAEAMFVSQSTLSAGIRELESLLGVTLVERSRRVVRFTPLGNAVVAKAHRLLREAEELSDLVQASGKPLAGELRMSVIPTIAPFFLPRILPRLRKERPALKLFLREETSDHAVESLHHGRADCVLLALPFATGEVEMEHIADDRLFIALPKDDPRDPPAVFSPEMIDEGRLLLLEDGHCLKEHALAAWRETEAQAKDIPRGRIMRDETLADLASHPPHKQEDLAKVRGLSQAWKDNDIGRRLMRVLRDAEPLAAEEMPDKPKRGAPLGKEGALVADLLKLLLKIRTREIDVAARLLTRSEELEALAAGVRKLPVLEGWRYEVFGKDALDLVEGKLAFAVEKGRLKMTHIDDVEVAVVQAPVE